MKRLLFFLILIFLLKNLSIGTVLVDVAVDQGGCFETSKPTTYGNPTYEVDNIIHYCVRNIPSAVPFTATNALNEATKHDLTFLDSSKYLSNSRFDN